MSLYARLKAEVEKLLLDDGQVVTLGLATVFGVSPRMRTDLLVNNFVLRAVRDRAIVLFEADFKRNYLHIRDAAAAFIYCLQNFEQMKDQPYNVGLSEANLSKRELCDEIRRQIPDLYWTESKIGEDPDKRDYIVSNAKIEAAGFKARHSLQKESPNFARRTKSCPEALMATFEPAGSLTRRGSSTPTTTRLPRRPYHLPLNVSGDRRNWRQ